MKEVALGSHPDCWRLIGGASPRACRHNAPVQVIVRPERAEDAVAVATLVEAAFGQRSEALLVELLRASPCYIPELSLVAEVDGHVAGHVMVTTAWVDDGRQRRPVANLAPLAVEPPHQRTGVGSALMRAVIAEADARAEPLVILQGDPRYYGRFGFESSVESGITMDLPDWAPREAAQVLKLGRYDPAIRGHVVLPSAFEECELDH